VTIWPVTLSETLVEFMHVNVSLDCIVIDTSYYSRNSNYFVRQIIFIITENV
jgi:hypothetical protein